jgi:hypothetical protein
MAGDGTEVYTTSARGDNLAVPKDLVTESATEREKETPEAKAKRESDAKTILETIKEIRATERAEDQFRKDAKDDADFRVGTKGDRHYQWPPQVVEKRKAEGRLITTINRMPSFVRQVTNQARQARLRIRVNPSAGHGAARVKIAEVIQGIIRNIETDSFADRAYNKAADKQAEQGRGFFRLITEWADEKSFQQKIKIRQEKDPLCIYFDPNCQEADYSDAWWAHKIVDLSDDDFESQTGEKAPTEQQITAFVGDDTDKKDWFPAGKTRFVESFRKEKDGPPRKLAELSTPTRDVIEYPDEAGLKKLKDAGITILRTRDAQKYKMTWRKLTGLKVYETTTWAGEAPPWIPVIGEENEADGELDFRGVVRDAKQPAMLFNVESAALLEAIGLGIKASIVGYKGQFGAENSATRRAWESANTTPHVFLEIEPVTIDGKPAPIPQRQMFEAPVEAIIAGIQQTDADLKSTAGWHDDSLGVAGRSDSGKAITARQRQDELGSSHYLDNLRFALCSAGKQLIRLIRVTYTMPQVVRITGNDDVARDVMVFSGKDADPRDQQNWQVHPASATQHHKTAKGEMIAPGQPIPFELPEGVKEIYDLSVGEFDVEVSAAPDPGTRRQEQMDALTGVFKTLRPEITEKFLDLLFQLGDLPVFQQMSERAKKLGLGMSDDDGQMANWPPEAQAIVGKMKAELQKMQQELQAATMKLATKQPELESRERIAKDKNTLEMILAHLDDMSAKWEMRAKHETAIAVAEISSKAKEPDLTKVEIARLGVQSDDAQRAHESIQANADRTHEATQAEQDRQHEAEQAEAARTAAVQAQESSQQHDAAQTERAAQAEPTDEGGGA